MAERFHFDLTNGQSAIRDHSGVNARDLEEAAVEAQFVIEELRNSGELSEDQDGWVLIIEDAVGHALMTLPVAHGILAMNS